MPMLVLSGEKAGGKFLIEQGRMVADNVEGVLVKGSGHWLMEEAPEQVIPRLVAFLAYGVSDGGRHGRGFRRHAFHRGPRQSRGGVPLVPDRRRRLAIFASRCSPLCRCCHRQKAEAASGLAQRERC